MALAYDTAAATPDGQKKIQEFAVGDSILAGSPSGKSGLKWEPAKVGFSSGSGGGTQQPTMVFIRCGENRIICTTDHPFLLADGTIKIATRLIPTVDRLVDGAGEPVDISDTATGSYIGGVHAVATDVAFNGSLDKHLLLTAGVVTGDYYLELHLGGRLKEGSAGDGAESLIADVK